MKIIENESMGKLQEEIREFYGVKYIACAIFPDLEKDGRSVIDQMTQKKFENAGVWMVKVKQGRKTVSIYRFCDFK